MAETGGYEGALDAAERAETRSKSPQSGKQGLRASPYKQGWRGGWRSPQARPESQPAGQPASRPPPARGWWAGAQCYLGCGRERTRRGPSFAATFTHTACPRFFNFLYEWLRFAQFWRQTNVLFLTLADWWKATWVCFASTTEQYNTSDL